MNIYKFFALILLVAFSGNAFPQSKPKRDTSKDRSVLNTKKQAQKKRNKSYQAKQSPSATIRQKVVVNNQSAKTQPSQKKASFLLVNQLTEVNRTVNYSRNSETFDVKTDGKNWKIINNLYWCIIKKEGNSFVLTCTENPNYEKRSGSFSIMCDGKEVKFHITQLGALFNAHGVFSNVKLQHNKKWTKDTKCLKINATLSLSLSGPKKATFRVYALFYDSSGQSITAKSKYSDYSIPASKEVVSSTIINHYNSFATHQINLFIPNNAFNLWNRKHIIKCVLLIYSIDTQKIIETTKCEIYFKAKNKKGRIRTRKI